LHPAIVMLSSINVNLFSTQISWDGIEVFTKIE
jgi:hypothetical protein